MLAFQFRATLCGRGAVPFPVRDWKVGVLEALLAKLKLADAVPEACGVKVRMNGAELPAAIVTGSEMPLSANSGLLKLADDTVTLAPVAVSVPLWAKLVPTVTLPKLRLVGAKASCPAAIPVALKGMARFGLEASEVTERVPLTLPAAAGVKATLKVKL